MEDTENTSVTTVKTLWTETILEVLYLALKYEKPDKDIIKIISQIRAKGKKPSYIINKVLEKLGEDPARRVKRLIKSAG